MNIEIMTLEDGNSDMEKEFFDQFVVETDENDNLKHENERLEI